MHDPFRYEIRLSTNASPTDEELEQLLARVYVDGGFTKAETAVARFAAEGVRARGNLLVALECATEKPIGMVIVVPPDSAARQFAKADEAEMHLLGVLTDYRGAGVGLALVNAALEFARRAGYARMLLWSQPTMQPAHQLYYKVGFVRDPSRDFRREEDEQFLFMQAEL